VADVLQDGAAAGIFYPVSAAGQRKWYGHAQQAKLPAHRDLRDRIKLGARGTLQPNRRSRRYQCPFQSGPVAACAIRRRSRPVPKTPAIGELANPGKCGSCDMRAEPGGIGQSGARKMRKPARRVRPVNIEIRHGYLRGMNRFDGRSTNARVRLAGEGPRMAILLLRDTQICLTTARSRQRS
jgi:hypothetical protein